MIKILLADDQYLIQEGIKSILRDETKIEIVGMAKNGIEAIALAKKLQPNIILLDIEMPKVNGIEVTKHICSLLPNTKIIVLSSHNSQKYITQALEAGASSYLLKDSFVEDLKQAIYSLSRGYSYIEVRLLNQALDKIKVNNIVNSQHKPINMKKYRKGIYTAAKISDIQHPSTQVPKDNQSTLEISKSSLAPIVDSSPSHEIHSADELHASLRKISSSTPKSVRRRKRFNKRFVLFILAIASLIFSVIIFG